ncbi:MAG: TonB-dependent receptor [Gammaproteobacteria bacterium]|nr:TonB-dependent receptor [Gammaproteobacteria bacterium]MCW8911359.1 TonB-dependent receptor [Gammaproteobacteria bacterium]
MHNRQILYTCILLLLYSSQALSYTASESETLGLVYGNEQMVSIATGGEQLLYKAPSVASIITSKDIKQSNARFLNELLEMVPGLHISDDYNAADAVYTMRGFFRDPDAGMLLLIDGIPVNTLQDGSRPSSFKLPVNNIEQVEIIRGPGSAVYGADAFVGVINVITKNTSSKEEYGTYLGSFQSQSYWLHENHALGKWETSISLQLHSTNGDKDRLVENDLQSYLDSITATQSSLSPSKMNTESEIINLQMNFDLNNWQLKQWFWMNNDQGSGHGIPGLDTLDPDGQIDSQSSLTSIEYNNKSFAKNWSLNARLSYLDYKTDKQQTLLPAGSNAPIGLDGNLFTTGIWLRDVNFPNGMIDEKETREQHSQFEISSFYSGWSQHNLRLASGYQQQSFAATESRNYGPGVLDAGQTSALNITTDVSNTANVFLPDGTRHIRYLSLQDEWDFITDWTLTAGIRYDNYSDFGDTTNPRLALVWQTDYDLTSKLLYGRAFRAPVYEELNLQNQLGFSGNPELKPETIDTLELAFDYRPQTEFRGILSLFAYKAKDLILAVEDINIANTYTYENAGTQNGYGMEAELYWLMSSTLSVSANYAWQYNTLDDTKLEAINAPATQIYIGVNWALDTFWKLNTELHYIGQRARALDDPRAAIDNYIRLDSRLTYRNHYKNWDCSISIRNLLDSDVREPSLGNDSIQPGGAALANDIPMEGVKALVEFRYYPSK